MNLLEDQRIALIIVALLIGLITSGTAWKMGYFRLPYKEKNLGSVQLRFRDLLGAYGLLFVIQLLIVPSLFVAWEAMKQKMSAGGPSVVQELDSPIARGWLNLIGIGCTAIALSLYYAAYNAQMRFKIWRGVDEKQGDKEHEILHNFYNFFLGSLTWIIAYPWIVVLSQAIGLLLEYTHLSQHIDQVAVKHLKEVVDDPLLLVITISSVVIIVPFIEELLFRGFLLTWLKELCSLTKAIVVSSVIFSLFHFSISQGYENIELLLSLFLLSCFLGFIRERQHSLWASLGLHSTFNFISIAMILEGV